MFEQIAVSAVTIAMAIGVFAAGLAGARAVARALLNRRGRRIDELESRGMIYDSDFVLRFALIIVWGGVALSSLSLLPAAVWVLTADGEAGVVAVRLFVVTSPIALVGAVVAFAGSSVLVLEPDRLTRVGAFGERSIDFAAVTGLDEARTLPAIILRGSGGHIRISRTVAGFDDLFNRLTASLDSFVVHAHRDSTAVRPQPMVIPTDGRYAVGRLRLRLTIGFLVALLLFFVAWPWFLVQGDHPVRDSFAFVGIGLVMWLGIAFLIRNETMQPGQPIELHLKPSSIAWRNLRAPWQEFPQTYLVSASVETTIIYVKGQPGHRYPLRLRFIGDEVVEIDDFRARHLGTSTQLLGAEVRARYLHTECRTAADRTASDEAIRSGGECEQAGAFLDAAEWYRRAIALWPSPDRLAGYRHIGDLLRLHGSTPEHRASAIGHYRAHVDLHPADASAWQALGAILPGGYRTDLADQAIATAEQLLLSGSDTAPDAAWDFTHR